MKITVFLTFICFSVFCQNNIVPNFSFEEINDYSVCGTRAFENSYIEKNKYWGKVDNWKLPKRRQYLGIKTLPFQYPATRSLKPK